MFRVISSILRRTGQTLDRIGAGLEVNAYTEHCTCDNFMHALEEGLIVDAELVWCPVASPVHLSGVFFTCVIGISVF